MRVFGSLVVLVLALGGGYFVLHQSALSPGQPPPQQQSDVVAIRHKLLAIAQAERQYLVTHGSYATLEQLAGEDLLPGGTELRGYTLSAATTGGDRFTITAAPTDANKPGWPTLDVTEWMEVTQR